MIDLSIYRQASFEGVEFECLRAGLRFSHRLDVKEYPYRSEGLVTDMGLTDDKFELAMFVIGDDFITRRADLERVLRKPGPGLLVHPTRGEIQVQVEQVRQDEDYNELGVADFTVTFVKAGSRVSPRALVDTQAAVITAGAATADATKEAIVYTDLTDPQVMVSAEESLTSMTDALNTASGVVNSASPEKIIGGLEAVKQLRATLGTAYTNLAASRALTGQVQTVVQSWVRLVNDPLDFALGLSNLGSVARLIDDGYFPSGNTIVRNAGVYSYKAAGVSGPTANNRLSIAEAFDIGLMQTAAERASDTEFPTLAKALSARDTITAGLDTVITKERPTATPETIDRFRSTVRALKTAVYRDLTERAGQLPALESYTPAARQPVRVLAYRLAKDNDNADAIVSRNGIRHPSFTPSAQPLFYLSSGRRGNG